MSALDVEQVARQRLASLREQAEQAELAKLVGQLRAEQEQEQEQAEAQRQAEQEQAERECDRLTAKRDAALTDVRVDLAALSSSLTVYLSTEKKLQDASLRAGRSYKRLAETVTDLIVVGLRDAGLGAPLPWVGNAWANRLREIFPALGEAQHSTAAPRNETKARCTVCAHPERDAIECLLRSGGSYRPIAATYGVSRSAISRHRQHA